MDLRTFAALVMGAKTVTLFKMHSYFNYYVNFVVYFPFFPVLELNSDLTLS